MKSLKLNNNVMIPQIAFGTAAIGRFQRDDDYVKDVILNAIKAGYRHIDTASLYGNERSVGRAVKESGIAREEFFITSKVWDSEQGTAGTLAAFDRSLRRLDMDYMDLYLVHWPVPSKTKETWQAMDMLYDQQRVKALGLSNFRPGDIEQIKDFAKIQPCYNQLELHPYLIQDELCAYCESQEIVVACWSPLGSGDWSGTPVDEKPVSDERIAEIAQAHQVTSAQVLLKWSLQQGRIVIPKAESPEHIVNNLQLEEFELTEAELRTIDGLNRDLRFGADPDTAYQANMQMKVPD